MKLQKLFVQEYGKNGTAAALLKCDSELRRRMAGICGWEDCTQYFFHINDGGILAPNERYEELMDFWEVYRQFDHEIRKEVKSQLWIMQMLYESDMKKTFWENRKKKAGLSERQKENLAFLIHEIERPISKKSLAILKKSGEQFQVCKKIDVENLDPTISTEERAFVENELMGLFHDGGIAGMVVGRLGLTPRRFYAYAVKGDACRKCSKRKVERLKGLIAGDNKEAEWRGRLAGFQDAYVETPD